MRYLEVDQQGVVFNMWYLGYFDEAMSQFLEEGGLPYERLLAGGHDLQLVHSSIDWKASLRWPDEATVAVRLVSVGNTSFALGFEVADPAGRVVATGRTVYVVVGTDGGGKRPVPPELAGALGPPAGEPG